MRRAQKKPERVSEEVGNPFLRARGQTQADHANTVEGYYVLDELIARVPPPAGGDPDGAPAGR